MRRWGLLLVWAAVAACASEAAPRKASRTTPPHCAANQPTPGCDVFGYKAGATTCTREGDIDLTRCMPARDPVLVRSPPPGCGNGKIDVVTEESCAACTADSPRCPCETVTRKLETCDGKDLDGASCKSLGYAGGRLRCTPSCDLDTSGCEIVDPKHRWKARLAIAGLAGWTPGIALHGAIGAVPGSVAVAWGVQDQANRPRADVVFAWSDPTLRVLRASPPFDAGMVQHLRLAGNARGWLLAISTYDDVRAKEAKGVRVYPISARGHVGKPGARVDRQDVLFLARGAPGEPSLVGALHGFMPPKQQPQWRLDGWLVDDQGEPLTPPFEIGTSVLTYSVMGAQAAYVGGGRFLTARGSTRNPAIELTLVDGKGGVQVLPVAHADLIGTPVGLVVDKDRVKVAYARDDQAYVAEVTLEGKLLGTPRKVGHGRAAALIGPARKPSLVTGPPLELHAVGASSHRVAAYGHVAMVADAADAAYALLVQQDAADLIRLR